jgi:hypothetical protein
LKVAITSPKSCQRNLPAGKHVRVEGTYESNLTGREIWVLVYASDHKYYPLPSNACQMLPADAAAGHWATTLFDKTAEQLDIVVTVVPHGSYASDYFKDWSKDSCDTGKFPGISELPNGVTEMAAITVKTKKPILGFLSLGP